MLLEISPTFQFALLAGFIIALVLAGRFIGRNARKKKHRKR